MSVARFLSDLSQIAAAPTNDELAPMFVVLAPVTGWSPLRRSNLASSQTNEQLRCGSFWGDPEVRRLRQTQERLYKACRYLKILPDIIPVRSKM